MFHSCILFWRYIVSLVTSPSGFFQTLITFLYWCGFSFSVGKFSPSILVILMYHKLSNERVLGLPSIHPHKMGYQYNWSGFRWPPDTLKNPFHPSIFLWCCYINSTHWLSVILPKVRKYPLPTNTPVTSLKSSPEIDIFI